MFDGFDVAVGEFPVSRQPLPVVRFELFSRQPPENVLHELGTLVDRTFELNIILVHHRAV